jgi:hypothetical protein
MSNLVSPGVQVQIIDESFYAGAGAGTVPFIMMATAQDKGQPGNTTAIAPGTVKANANKLYAISSQRELIQTFGNPIFPTQAGTPQYGSELAEWGLYAAYQYLGLANRAYVMRADVDLAALESSSVPPTGAPRNGSYWLDTQNTAWGVFRSNGNINSSLAWGAVRPIVLDSADLLQLACDGVTAIPILDPNAPLGEAGQLVINKTPLNLQVTVLVTDSLLSIVQKINTAIASSQNLNTRVLQAEVTEQVRSYQAGSPTVTQAATVYNMRILSSDVNITSGIQFVNSTPDVLTALGLTVTPALKVMPIPTLGTVGSIAVNAYKSVNVSNVLATQVQMYEKIVITTQTQTRAEWFLIGSPEWQQATPTQVTGTQSTIIITPGHVSFVQLGSTSFSFTNAASTLQDLVQQLNEEFAVQDVNAVARIHTQGPDSYLRITNYDGTQIRLIDQVGNLFGGVGISQNQTFFAEVVGTENVLLDNPVFDPLATLRITVGGYLPADIDPAGGGLTDLVNAINASSLGASGENLITASVQSEGINNFLKIQARTGTFFSIQNNTAVSAVTPISQLVGIPCGTTAGNQLVFQGYSVQTPQPRNVDQITAGNIWINTNPGNRGASWSVKRYNAGTDIWQARPAPLYEDDASANEAYSSQRTVGSVYVKYNSGSVSPVQATFEVRIWTGTAWSSAAQLQLNNQAIPYSQSSQTPTASPDAGALWFNQNLRVDIMVSTGQIWSGYRNLYPETDPNGVILSATAPSTQSDGFTPLADQDLWIDTSDLENYPKCYRYDSFQATWTLIDNTDQTSSQGMVFADVRPNVNGELTGSENISDMLVSDYTDLDAPSALTYPFGMLVFNMRYSTNNVKEWRPNYLSMGTYRDRWVTVSGLQTDGAPYMGRKAQRRMVVQGMAAAIVSNQDIRAEANFFNLLAAPGYTELLDELVTLNTDKKDVAFVVVDPPARLPPDGTSIQAWATNSNNAGSNGEQGLITRSRYAGVYYPWGLATNLDGTEVFVPPSVAVLRTLAFNDQVSYPWFAPAGFNRGLVSVLTSVGFLTGENEYQPVQLNQGQSDFLYLNDVNPIRFIPGRGLVIYGQKTLSPVDSALDRINVARLINYLNYQLDNLAKPFLFEPNDQYTRDSVQRTFESFMGDLVALRAVFDFAVLCDESNNLPERIDRNELYIDIAIKPVKSIEFIYIPVRILNTGDPLPT